MNSTQKVLAFKGSREIFRRTADELLRWAASTSLCKRGGVGAALLIKDLDEWRMHIKVRNGSPDCTGATGVCGCMHAEARLIASLAKLPPPRWHGLALILTHSPCEQCARLIVETKLFDGVWWADEYRTSRGAELIRAENLLVVL